MATNKRWGIRTESQEVLSQREEIEAGYFLRMIFLRCELWVSSCLFFTYYFPFSLLPITKREHKMHLGTKLSGIIFVMGCFGLAGQTSRVPAFVYFSFTCIRQPSQQKKRLLRRPAPPTTIMLRPGQIKEEKGFHPSSSAHCFILI